MSAGGPRSTRAEGRRPGGGVYLVEAVMVVCLTGSEVMVFSMMDKGCVDDEVF